ncbi:zinc finger, matrin-type 2 [Bonamia ostreae]|uniref:Zinc finger, matrin-type 2 n=1 Tax=Bonamia ostreae TaxID=126728 RepID=A0ABV2AGY5_9EUKA
MIQNSRKSELAIPKRKPLQADDRKIELLKEVGKTNVITSSTPLSKRGGFYCESCECLLRDSHSYLDHVNGKKHQKLLGMHMRVQKSSVDQVRKKLKELKNRKIEKKEDETDIIQKMEAARIKEEKRKIKKRKR